MHISNKDFSFWGLEFPYLSSKKLVYFTVLEGRKCKRLWLGDFVNLALKYSILLSEIMSRPANIKLQFIFVLGMNEWEWQLCHLKRRQSLAELCALSLCSPPRPAAPRSPRECHRVTPHCTCCLHFNTNTLNTEELFKSFPFIRICDNDISC